MAEKMESFGTNIEDAKVLIDAAGWREGSGQYENALGYILMAENALKKAKAYLRAQKRTAA